MSLKFQRTKENFKCLNCGFLVVGDGFTNHCPKCLWSRHVDNYPGDRQNHCQGLMKPINAELLKGEYVIIHQCQKCGVIKKNLTSHEDDIGSFLSGML